MMEDVRDVHTKGWSLQSFESEQFPVWRRFLVAPVLVLLV